MSGYMRRTRVAAPASPIKQPRRCADSKAAAVATKKTSPRPIDSPIHVRLSSPQKLSPVAKRALAHRAASSAASDGAAAPLPLPPPLAPPPVWRDFDAASAEDSYAHYGHDHGETGRGHPRCPYRQPLRAEPNRDGCHHCPAERCFCQQFQALLAAAVARVGVQRETEGRPGRKDLCAKSLNPNFVARLVREMRITEGDTFFDFGSGNGSILFQVAFVTGARCVGIELNAHNAALSKQLWAVLRPQLEQLKGRAMPDVEIIAGDVLDYVADPRFVSDTVNARTGNGPAILCSNMLWPRQTTHYLQERCRECAVGTRIACFDDFFPHGRCVSITRDPEAFELFEMRDYVWPRGATEWAPALEGSFFVHRKVKNRNQLGADFA